MESGSQATGDGAGVRSGGKILKQRRIAPRKTPYDRPTPPPQPEGPNWFDGLVFPAKYVAGGATKLLSSFWNPKSWGSHSSSSDSDSDSEGGIEDDCEDNDNLSDGDINMNQNKGSSPGKSEILYLVEQLLMLERYSREECDRLIEIINSRVLEYTAAGPSKIDDSDICNQIIMEARTLIRKYMVGSSSKSDLVNGSKSLTTSNRDHLSGGSWNIEDEISRLRSKSTAAPQSEDIRTTQDDFPTDALSSLPTIDEQNQMAEEEDEDSEQNRRQSGEVISLGKEKEVEDDVTESTDYNDAIGYINASQGSSNYTNDSPKKADVKRAATRSRRTNSRRGRGRGK